MLAFRRWKSAESGTTSIEYAIIVSLVSCTIFITLSTLGANLSNVLYSLSGPAPSTPPAASTNVFHG